MNCNWFPVKALFGRVRIRQLLTANLVSGLSLISCDLGRVWLDGIGQVLGF